MSGNIIEIANLTKRYGSLKAVDTLNLSIRKSEIFGLLGPNGAGKSTVILMLLGLTEPDSGSVSVCGINPTHYPVEVKKRVGYLPEDIGFYDNLTGLENLIYTARINRIPGNLAADKALQMMVRVGLSNETGKKTGNYSRGMRQRLGLAEVLIKNPEVIILDEPTLGIDPTGVRDFLNLIVRLSKKEDITVLLSSHHLHQVQQICDRVGLFVEGKLLAEGDVQTLSQELLAHSPFIIEAGISGISSLTSDTKSEMQTTKWLKKVLRHIDGIKKINQKNSNFIIECLYDSTSDIAKAIIESGAGLRYLNKKEYGLDDIYYRYFEGGMDHE